MIGNEIHKFAKELWPINRSITGKGVRETLQKISLQLMIMIRIFLMNTSMLDLLN